MDFSRGAIPRAPGGVDEGVGVFDQELIAGVHADGKPKRFLRGSIHMHLKADLPALEAGGPADGADEGGRHDFKPHGLPDAGGAWIPDGVRFELPVLLAAGLFEIGRVIVGADDDLLGTVGGENIGDFDGEGGVAALVPADLDAVDPHPGDMVDRAEVENKTFAGFQLRSVKGSAVPDGTEEAGVADAAACGFGGERHLNLGVPEDLGEGVPLGARIDGEVPLAVERGPLRALQLRSGIARLRA